MFYYQCNLLSLRDENTKRSYQSVLRNQFRHYPKQNVCFGCFASIPKQRVSMFRLNRNKQKTNRNSLIRSIFCHFLQKIQCIPGFFRFFFSVFSFFFGLFRNSLFRNSLFRNSLFRLFRFYTETESLDVSIEPKQTEDPPIQFKREYIWVFFRKFRVFSV